MDTEKGVCGKRAGPSELSSGWKGGRLWVRLNSLACEPVRSPKITSGKEMVRNSVIHLKDNGVPSPHTWWDDSKKPVTQCSKSISALNRGILKRKNNRDTVHFTADALNTELLYRTIHSANQLSNYGAVACWCENSCLKPDETSEKLVETEKGSNTERSETARSFFFVQNSKDRRARIWKQTARMHSKF